MVFPKKENPRYRYCGEAAADGAEEQRLQMPDVHQAWQEEGEHGELRENIGSLLQHDEQIRDSRLSRCLEIACAQDAHHRYRNSEGRYPKNPAGEGNIVFAEPEYANEEFGNELDCRPKGQKSCEAAYERPFCELERALRKVGSAAVSDERAGRGCDSDPRHQKKSGAFYSRCGECAADRCSAVQKRARESGYEYMHRKIAEGIGEAQGA